ncbi:MAG TPA: tRNA (adenosine(37)-N6)-threonylcarbamoyltransferase complex dimerization subunit type 1 TsaB [Cyclobacteriaceae bacterium]
MALILSLETATSVCSVALSNDGEILASSHLHIGQSASSKLAVMIDELLRRCDKSAEDLSAVAVSAGPGSYTGLRIGVATAKGMCFALNIPLIAVNTLESMVAQIATHYSDDELFCPMIDARRMEVYCSLLKRSLEIMETTQAKVIDESSFSSVLENNKIIFFGNGASKCQGAICNTNAIFLSDIHPSAVDVGLMAYEKFKNQEFENLAEFEPFYLKDFLIKKPKSTV